MRNFTADEWILTFWLALAVVLLVCGAFFLMRKQEEREAMVDDEQQSVDEILNSKIPLEKNSVTVHFGKDIIQLSPDQWVLWNSWTRVRKRIFVREFKKLSPKQLK